MKKLFLFILIIIFIAFAWHLHIAYKMTKNVELDVSKYSEDDIDFSVKINPISNVITIILRFDLADDDFWSSLGVATADGIAKAPGPQMLERELAKSAREHYDVYSRFIPYRVKIISDTEALLKE